MHSGLRAGSVSVLCHAASFQGWSVLCHGAVLTQEQVGRSLSEWPAQGCAWKSAYLDSFMLERAAQVQARPTESARSCRWAL